MSFLRSAVTVGVGTMASRLLGFVRDILIAAVMGAGPVADAFVVAFKLPNLFRRLFAEGAFNAAFVPLFGGRVAVEGEASAQKFAEQSLSALLVILLALTVAAEIFMPQVMYVMAPGFSEHPAKFTDAVLFGRIMFPYLLFISLMALYAGVLNSLLKFAAAAYVPVLLNLISVITLAFIIPYTGYPGETLSWSIAFAGVAQFLAIAYASHRSGFRLHLPRPRLTPDVKRLLKLALPGAVAGGIAQINLLVGNVLASMQEGAVSYFYYADRLYQLPLGVVAAAIGIVLLPDLSRRLRLGDHQGVIASQNRALEFALLLTLPAAIALLVIPVPIVSVLFERGAFTAADAQATALTVAAFAAGLPAYMLIKIFTPAFFAREDTVTPLKFAAISVVSNIALALVLNFWMGFIGIAIATSIAAWINAGLLAWRGAQIEHLQLDARSHYRLPRILLSSVGLGVMLWVMAQLLAPWLTGPAGASGMLALVALVVGGMAGFTVICHLSGAARLADIRAAIRRS